MRPTRPWLPLLALIWPLLVIAPALAVADDVCVSCHSTADALSSAGPRAKDLVVEAKSLAGSVHDGFSCTQCHADLAADDAPIPHPEKLNAVDCSMCHPDPSSSMTGSIHTTHMPLASGAKSTCSSCHGKHQIRAAKDPESPTHPQKVADLCGACHAKTGKEVEEWKNSVHGRAALDWEVTDAPTCVGCHKPHSIRAIDDPQDPLNRRNRMKVCGSCHPSELKIMLRGAHGKAWEKGNLAAANCTDCHGAHDVQRPRDRDSRVYAAQVSATCGKCHGDPDLTTRFGMRPDRVSTFEESFHGKGTRWQDASVANCASCHRYHDVRGAADPASPVNEKNLRATCGRADCHPGATETFAKLPVHAGATQTTGHKIVRGTKVAYIFIIMFTLSFMAVHQVVDLRAAYRERAKAKAHGGHHDIPIPNVPKPKVEPLTKLVQKDGKWVIERWNAQIVVQHLLNAVTFLTLVATGFALELPATWAEKLGLGPTLWGLRGLIHRIAAVLMIGVSIYHLVWLVKSRRGRRELAEMFPNPIPDGKHAWENIKFILGLREHAPPGRRYTYKEKAEYWALVWGTFVMVATGIVLWSASYWNWVVVEVSRVVHSYEAILAFGAIVIWHLFTVQFRPGIWPTNPTWMDGTATVHSMKEEHAQEYAEMVAWHGVDPDKDAHGTDQHGGKGDRK